MSTHSILTRAHCLFVATIQTLSLIMILAATIRWVQLVKTRQNVGRFNFKLLNLEEFTFLLFLSMTLSYSPLPTIWSFVTGDLYWNTHTAATLIYLMCVNVVFGALIIGEDVTEWQLYHCIYIDICTVYMYVCMYVCMCSCSWPHRPQVGRGKYEYAQLEADFRAVCVTRDKVSTVFASCTQCQ